eukprot:symbB.v1.2.031611.t1/scaffold3688.1/size51983/5
MRNLWTDALANTKHRRAQGSKETKRVDLCHAEGCSSQTFTMPDTSYTVASFQDASFHENTLYDRPEEEKVVRLWAKHHVEDHHLVAVLKAIEACQHEVVQTKGFGLKQNKLCVTGTKARRSSHKAGSTICFGLASA